MEKWKKTQYEGYEISNLGNVRSNDRIIIRKDGKKYTAKGILRKKQLDKYGYPRVGLKVNGKNKNVPVHRLVAISFIPNPENKPEVNHKNGRKYDNQVENLEWVTSSENQRHAFETGLQKKQFGEEHASNKLKEEDVIQIRKRLENNETCISISKDYNVTPSNISCIKRRVIWGSLQY